MTALPAGAHLVAQTKQVATSFSGVTARLFGRQLACRAGPDLLVQLAQPLQLGVDEVLIARKPVRPVAVHQVCA